MNEMSANSKQIEVELDERKSAIDYMLSKKMKPSGTIGGKKTADILRKGADKSKPDVKRAVQTSVESYELDEKFDLARRALVDAGIPHMGERKTNKLKVHPKFKSKAQDAMKKFKGVDLEINHRMPEKPMSRESVELDELDAKTLIRYNNKASAQVTTDTKTDTGRVTPKTVKRLKGALKARKKLDKIMPGLRQEDAEFDEATVVDPITKKRVKTKPIKQKMGGPATKDGKPFLPGKSKHRQKLGLESSEVDEAKLKYSKDMPDKSAHVAARMAMKSKGIQGTIRDNGTIRVAKSDVKATNDVLKRKGVKGFRATNEEVESVSLVELTAEALSSNKAFGGWTDNTPELNENVPLDEMPFEFPDERKAKQFDYDVGNSGIGVGNRVGNKVTLSKVDPKWHPAVKKYVQKNKGKSVKESTELDEGVGYKKPEPAHFAKKKDDGTYSVLKNHPKGAIGMSHGHDKAAADRLVTKHNKSTEVRSRRDAGIPDVAGKYKGQHLFADVDHEIDEEEISSKDHKNPMDRVKMLRRGALKQQLKKMKDVRVAKAKDKNEAITVKGFKPAVHAGDLKPIKLKLRPKRSKTIPVTLKKPVPAGESVEHVDEEKKDMIKIKLNPKKKIGYKVQSIGPGGKAITTKMKDWPGHKDIGEHAEGCDCPECKTK